VVVVPSVGCLCLLNLLPGGPVNRLDCLANSALAMGPDSSLLLISWLINEVEEAKLSDRRSIGGDMSPL